MCGQVFNALNPRYEVLNLSELHPTAQVEKFQFNYLFTCIKPAKARRILKQPLQSRLNT
jgi:hypothetical protein